MDRNARGARDSEAGRRRCSWCAGVVNFDASAGGAHCLRCPHCDTERALHGAQLELPPVAIPKSRAAWDAPSLPENPRYKVSERGGRLEVRLPFRIARFGRSRLVLTQTVLRLEERGPFRSAAGRLPIFLITGIELKRLRFGRTRLRVSTHDCTLEWVWRLPLESDAALRSLLCTHLEERLDELGRVVLREPSKVLEPVTRIAASAWRDRPRVGARRFTVKS